MGEGPMEGTSGLEDGITARFNAGSTVRGRGRGRGREVVGVSTRDSPVAEVTSRVPNPAIGVLSIVEFWMEDLETSPTGVSVKAEMRDTSPTACTTAGD